MKRPLSLLLVCLCLCGCAAAPAAEAPIPQRPSSAVSVAGSPDDGSILRAFPLGISDANGLIPFGEQLLLFSGRDITTLTLLRTADLTVTAETVLDIFLSAGDPSLRVGTGALSFYDPVQKETLVLDTSLNVLRQISLPGNAVGSPILSSDGETLYYCTSDAIRSLDLLTGIRRCIKALSYSHQSLSGLFLEDTVLQCSITDGDAERTLFLSSETGQTLGQLGREIRLLTLGSRYYACFPSGMIHAAVFGDRDGQPKGLFPETVTAQTVFLPEKNGAVTVEAEPSSLRLDYYDLDSGLRRCTLSIATEQTPEAIVSGGDGAVYILTCDTLYRWDVEDPKALCSDGTVYTFDYSSGDDPDPEGLAQCRSLAQAIGRQHGIEILIWEEAAAVQPWDYDLDAECLVPVIRRELQLLEKRLAQYPEGFLAATAAPFTSLKLCLVRQIRGTAESGSLNLATGLQFVNGTDAYVVIAAGAHSERALYHELFHVMQTRILNESIAFDQWDKLNPSGFSYDYDYLANATRDAGIYLHRENRAFIDTYSMSFPKEDRARIMEYAMMPGNRELFQGKTLQAKLKAVCEGIREAYGLEKEPVAYPWEQYLQKPLARSQ